MAKEEGDGLEPRRGRGRAGGAKPPWGVVSQGPGQDPGGEHSTQAHREVWKPCSAGRMMVEIRGLGRVPGHFRCHRTYQEVFSPEG